MGYLAATVAEPFLTAEHVGELLAQAQTSTPAGAGQSPGFRPLEEEVAELERRRIIAALEACGGNQTRAAELLAVPRRTFVTKLQRYGIGKP